MSNTPPITPTIVVTPDDKPSPPSLVRRPGFVRAPSSQVRFQSTAMVLTMPERPMGRRANSGSGRVSRPSPPVPTAPLATPISLNDQLPILDAGPPVTRPAYVFGMRTRYKPLWLLAMGVSGNVLYGTGALALERGIFPRRPVAPPGSAEAQLPGKLQPLFGNAKASIAVGAVGVAVGTMVAVTASTLFFADSRRLARRQNPAAPNYTRPNVYYSVHIGAILLSVGGKFMSEALRDVVARDTTWAAAIPSLIGQALFAVTQAQAFSGCEVLNRKMPLRHRTAIGFAARTGAGAWTVLGVMNTVPYFNPYVRELTRLFCQSTMTLAFSLPLTTARISRTAQVDPSAPAAPPSWYALNIMGVYLVGRALLGFAPDLLQRPQMPTADGAPTANATTGGAVMLAVGTAVSTAMIMMYRDDAIAYHPRKGNVLAAVGVGAILLITTYRGIFEIALASHNDTLKWLSTVPGSLGAGLRLAVLSELFAFSELRNGDLPLPQRYHWTEACRATGIVGYGLWAAMLSVPDFNPYVREAVGIYAALAATLGMALPTTTSRRALPRYDWPLSPGATPEAEVEGFSLGALRGV